jgi:hypothetical protein
MGPQIVHAHPFFSLLAAVMIASRGAYMHSKQITLGSEGESTP